MFSFVPSELDLNTNYLKSIFGAFAEFNDYESSHDLEGADIVTSLHCTLSFE